MATSCECHEPANPWFALIRAMKHAARLLLDQGVDDQQIRAELLDRAAVALPDEDSPLAQHREPLRAMLARALDAEILSYHLLNAGS